ncbi:MAG: amidohydrolase [Synergistaceae bacterium]|jgi:aminobenzoyl-glutamate utilization protein B|nr:amidohydrolase [Synergistaceae bacterium]
MSAAASKDRISALVEAKREKFIAVSDKIWGYSEIRFGLPQSADEICRALEGEGFSVERGVADMPHAFVASFSNGKGPALGFLGEYDALAGLSQKADSAVREPCAEGEPGHGCGHQALGAGSLAAATALKDYMKEAGLGGTVRYYGCPGEESGSGKAYMARAGLFSGLDAALTWHPSIACRSMAMSSLANYQIYFHFKGIAAHAAAAPHLGRSALDAVELMNIGVNYLREHVIQEARIHYALIDGGGHAPNVVQPKATSLYFIRAPKSSQVKDIYDRVVDIARGAALMSGTELSIEWDSACAEVVPNATLSELLYEKLNEIGPFDVTAEEENYAARFVETLGAGGKERVLSNLVQTYGSSFAEKAKQIAAKSVTNDILPYYFTETAMPGSTDVGDVSFNTPTGQIGVACFPNGTVEHSWQWVASGRSSICHKGMLLAGKVLALAGAELLTDAELLAKANSEFRERTADNAYHCAIPPEVKPH